MLHPRFVQRERDSGFEFAQMGGLGNGGWRGVLRVAQRESPLPGEGLCKLGLGRPAKAGVGAFGVIVFARGCQRGAGMVQRREQGLFQQLIAQMTVFVLN